MNRLKLLVPLTPEESRCEKRKNRAASELCIALRVNNLQYFSYVYRIKNIYPLDYVVKWDLSLVSGGGPIELMGLPHGYPSSFDRMIPKVNLCCEFWLLISHARGPFLILILPVSGHHGILS